MLVDANLLLYAADSTSPFHERAAGWLEESLNGPRRVALPWQSLGAFVRISAHPRAWERPLDIDAAVDLVRTWLAAPAAWVPEAGTRHAEILLALLIEHQVTGALVTDAQLAALAIEHGLAVCSADSDFARFREVTWVNPLS